METEYLILDRKFTFDAEIPSIDLIDTIENLRLHPNYIKDELFEPLILQKYTQEEASAMAKDYQYLFVDDMASVYLVDAKTQLMLGGGTNPQSQYHLPYQMILAMQRFIIKIWAKYDEYKLMINNGVIVEDIDYSIVGLPPCPFKDIQWVLDDNYQQKESNRNVNLDINYYINWV